MQRYEKYKYSGVDWIGEIPEGWKILKLKFLFKDVSVKNIAVAAIAATIIHWLVANVGMCVQENQFTFALYSQKLLGSITYELRFLAGTTVYAALMFGAFELLQKRFPSLRLI